MPCAWVTCWRAASELARAAATPAALALGSGHGLVILLRGDLLLFDQLLVTSQIILRFDIVGFRLLQFGLGGLVLLLRHLDPGTGAVDIRFSGRDLAAGIHRSDGDVHAGSDSSGLRILKVGLGTFVSDLIIRGIDFDQHGSRRHVLIVLHIELDNVAGDAGADRIDVAIDLGIVGRFVAGEITISKDANNQ